MTARLARSEILGSALMSLTNQEFILFAKHLL